jgi:transposase-like protein
MSQQFLLSAKARTLSLGVVLRMTDGEAEAVFRNVRWTDGKAICPHCECPTVYECRRPSGALRFRCKACRKDFSITSGTLFAFHKMPLRNYLAAIAIFCNEVKGKSALALSRDLDVQYKTAFVLAHKLREVMASELKGMRLGGRDKVVEVDGGYFGGYAKPANHKEMRRDRRLAQNQNGAQGCGRDAGARWPHTAGGVSVRECRTWLHRLPRRSRHVPDGRLSDVMERAARPVRRFPDRP